MSSGTLVKIKRYFNYYHYSSLETLNNDIKDAIKARECAKASLLALAMATPRDITPDGEIPIEHIEGCFNNAFDVYNDADAHLSALYDIKDGWETREED